MMKHYDINRLSEVQLILESITLPLKQLNRIEQMPIYRVELLLDNTVIDETADIISTVIKIDKCLQLTIGSASFRYKAKELFNIHKVARMKIRLVRCAIFTNEQDLLDQYHLVLSQYAYEYSRQFKNIFKQHSIGHIRRSFLYYTISCAYKQMQNKENEILKSIPQLKRNNYSLYESISQKQTPLSSLAQGILPIDSVQKDDLDMIEQDQQGGQTYISKHRLMPVFRSDRTAEEKIKIKLSYSFMNQSKDQQEPSVLEQTYKLSQKFTVVGNLLFYIFLLGSFLRIIHLMIPTSKV